jgi:hypothetical protein
MSLDDTPAAISTDHQIAHHLLGEFMAAHGYAPHVAIAAADAFLEATARDCPEAAPVWGNGAAEAEWWAEFATAQAISAMLSACLKRIADGQMPMAPNARKRALVAIWNSLTAEDRTAFLDYAQPGSAAKA